MIRPETARNTHLYTKTWRQIFFAIGMIVLLPLVARAEMPIDKVEFEGNDVFSDGRLKKFLRMDRISDYRETHLRSDLEVIFDFYRQNGYLQVERLESRDELTADDKRVYTIKISEGPQTNLGEIHLFGYDYLDSLAIRKMIDLHSGDPFNQLQLNQKRQALANEYANHGFAYATIRDSIHFRDDKLIADLSLLIEEGKQVVIDTITISGNKDVRKHVIWRDLESKIGDVFDLSLIQEDQQRLYSTGLFRDVRFNIQGLEEQKSRVDIQIQVVEEKLQWVGGGIGYGTADGGRLTIDYGHDNIFNNAQKLKLQSTFTKTDILRESAYYRFKRQFELEYIDPRLFKYRWTSGINLNYEYHDNQEETVTGHKLEVLSWRIGTGRTFWKYNQISLQLGMRVDTYFDVDEPDDDTTTDPDAEEIKAGGGRTITNSFTLSLSRNTRNDVFNPTRGYFVFGSSRLGGFFLSGDNNFVKYSFDSSGYYKFVGIIFSLRVQGGQVNSYGDSYTIEDSDLFTYGGSTTNRGYHEGQLGSLNHRSTSLNGNALLAGNLEFRIPVFGSFQTVLFADYGRLWYTPGEIERSQQSDYRTLSNNPATSNDRLSLGVGLRYFTPVGPLRVDWGFPMAPIHNWGKIKKNTGVLHISFGQTF